MNHQELYVCVGKYLRVIEWYAIIVYVIKWKGEEANYIQCAVVHNRLRQRVNQYFLKDRYKHKTITKHL